MCPAWNAWGVAAHCHQQTRGASGRKKQRATPAARRSLSLSRRSPSPAISVYLGFFLPGKLASNLFDKRPDLGE